MATGHTPTTNNRPWPQGPIRRKTNKEMNTSASPMQDENQLDPFRSLLSLLIVFLRPREIVMLTLHPLLAGPVEALVHAGKLRPGRGRRVGLLPDHAESLVDPSQFPALHSQVMVLDWFVDPDQPPIEQDAQALARGKEIVQIPFLEVPPLGPEIPSHTPRP